MGDDLAEVSALAERNGDAGCRFGVDGCTLGDEGCSFGDAAAAAAAAISLEFTIFAGSEPRRVRDMFRGSCTFWGASAPTRFIMAFIF